MKKRIQLLWIALWIARKFSTHFLVKWLRRLYNENLQSFHIRFLFRVLRGYLGSPNRTWFGRPGHRWVVIPASTQGLLCLTSLNPDANVKDSNPTPGLSIRQFWDGQGEQPEANEPFPCKDGKIHVCCHHGTNFCVEYRLFSSHHLCVVPWGIASSIRLSGHLCCSEIKYKTFTGTGPGPEGLDPAIGKAFKCDNFDGVYSVDPAEEPVTSQNNSPEYDVPEFDLNTGEVGNFLDLLFGVFGDH